MNTTSTLYNFLSALLAFCIWGSWSYYVNSMQSEITGFVSGITQGVASFIITLVAVYIVTTIYNLLPKTAWRLVIPAVITVSLTGVSLVIIHVIAGTPRIIPTISPSLTVAFLFCIFTTYKLNIQGSNLT